MAINPDAAFSRGDVMRRLAQAENDITALQTARRLPSASIGSGGLRLQGGRLLAEDSSGDRIFEVTTEPPGIFMQQELIASLTREILGEAIEVDTNILQSTTTTEDAFVDITFAGSPDPGPEVTVDVGPAGKAIVFVSAHIQNSAFTQAWMSFEVTGASSRAPTIAGGSAFYRSQNDPSSGGVGSVGVSLLTGLNEGSHTMTAKYRVSNLVTVAWSNRLILVIPF